MLTTQKQNIMKKVTTSTGEIVTVTKKDIANFCSLERSVSYYSALSENTLAHAVAIAPMTFGWDGLETKQDRIDTMYDRAKEMIEEYIKYEKQLEETF
jgi:hypothetical protein